MSKPDPELVQRLASQFTLEELKQIEAEQVKANALALDVAPHFKYQPNPPQYRWLQMLQKGLDEGRMKFGVFDANSAGKTLWLVNLIWAIMSPPDCRNPWFNLPFIVNWKWPKHIRLVCKATDLKDVTGTIWSLIDKWWPKGDYESQKQDFGYVAMYRHKLTRFFVSVRTFDQPPEQHDDGSTIGMLGVNEPCPTSVWSCYPARFREGGFMLATATLVRESQFFKDDVMDNPDAVYSMQDIEGNCREHSRLTVSNPYHAYNANLPEQTELRGTLEHSDLFNIIKNSPLQEQETRRTGRPAHLAGAAFIISPSVHHVPRSSLPPLSRCECSILTLDPHERRPWAFIVVLTDAFRKFWVADEWPRVTTAPWKMPYHKITNAGVGYEFYVKALNEHRLRWRVRNGNQVIDSKFAAKSLTTDQSAIKLRELLARRYKLRFASGATAVRGENGGITALTNALAFDAGRPVGFDNQPHFYVCDDLWNTKFQLENITWDEMADPNAYGQSESLDEKYLDFPRLCMYALMHKTSRGLREPPRNDEEMVAEFDEAELERKWKRHQRAIDALHAGSGSGSPAEEDSRAAIHV